MKKFLIIILSLSFILVACSKNAAKTPLIQLPDNYSLDDAKSDNCVVFENSDITYGQSIWDNFIAEIGNGIPSTVRLAFYYTLGAPSHYSEEYYEEIKDKYPYLFIKDLIYDGKKYIIKGFEDGRLISNEYKYLKKYEGKPQSETAIFSDYTYFVLVNDNTITWDQIEHGMYSSQLGDWIDHYKVYSDLVFK